MGDFLRAFACGFTRPFGGPHRSWCPTRRVMFEVPTSFYEQPVTKAPKPIRTNARFLE